MLTDFDIPTDPGRLNRWLLAHGGYVRGCNLVYDALRGLGANLSAIIECRNIPAPMDRITAALDAFCGVLTMVDAVPGGKLDQHWVRVLRVAGDDALVMDPWQLPGEERISLVKQYGKDGWTAARAILRVLIYTASHERVIAFEYA
jgi:hypothetical protein